MEITAAEERWLYKLTRKVWKAMKDYALVTDGDRVLVGLSGGKDSLALVEFLGERSRIHKPCFTVDAVHIQVENVPYQSDIAYLQQHCEVHHVAFHQVSTRFEERRDSKSPCFLCSWNRRKMLFETAQHLGCNKIALGHHQDDILETLLMNLCFQGAFATMPPLLHLQKMPLSIIRPLCLLTEAQLQRMAEIRAYRKQLKHCPYEHDSHRAEVKQLLAQFMRMNPDVRGSLWGAMTNIQTEYLPTKKP